MKNYAKDVRSWLAILGAVGTILGQYWSHQERMRAIELEHQLDFKTKQVNKLSHQLFE